MNVEVTGLVWIASAVKPNCLKTKNISCALLLCLTLLGANKKLHFYNPYSTLKFAHIYS